MQNVIEGFSLVLLSCSELSALRQNVGFFLIGYILFFFKAWGDFWKYII